MDNKLTQRLRDWLEAEPSQRDYEAGNEMLLSLSRNKVMYNNLARRLGSERAQKMIEYQLQKFYKARLVDFTHEEVETMQAEVDKITAFADREDEGKPSGSAEKMGKRADHDTLPAEIQALYVENLDHLQHIRQLHLQLRQMTLRETTCPDSDRFPFLKEIIRHDKLMRANWARYDAYVIGTPVTDSGAPDAGQPASDDDARAASRKANGTINLLKGRYKAAPSEELKEKILALYSQIINPTDKLIASLKELGIIE